MATGKPDRWASKDVAAQRLLDAIGTPELAYYNAADERALTEALQSWPLLATIARALALEDSAAESGARRPTDPLDPPLRVLDSRDDAIDDRRIEDADVLTSLEPTTKEN
jgi:hypothetical protein